MNSAANDVFRTCTLMVIDEQPLPVAEIQKSWVWGSQLEGGPLQQCVMEGIFLSPSFWSPWAACQAVRLIDQQLHLFFHRLQLQQCYQWNKTSGAAGGRASAPGLLGEGECLAWGSTATNTRRPCWNCL